MEKRMKVTKKTAQEIFKSVIGVSRDLRNIGDDLGDIWCAGTGQINACCIREGEYYRVDLSFLGEAECTVYFDGEGKINYTYTEKKNREARKEEMETVMGERGLVAVPVYEAVRNGIKPETL